MATKVSWNDTAPEGVVLDKKKNLKVTSYKGTVDLTADAFKDSGAKGIDASEATNALTLKGSTGALTFTTGANGSTVIGSSKNDKINLGTGADVIQNTVGSAGNDAINNYDSAKDVIEIYGKTSSQTTFTDKNASVVLTFNGSKEKLTVNKSSAGGSIAFKFSDGTFNYGSLPSGVTFDDASKKTALAVGTSVARNATIDASKIASTIKNIDATKAGSNAALNIVGNGQNNNISLGGGGTVYGGYAYDAAKGTSKATSDKLYGSDGKDTFVFDESLGGSDMVYGYNSDDGDVIYIKDKTAAQLRELLANTATFKDSGKNVVLTLNKSKLTVDGTPKQITFVGSDGSVVYGPELPTDEAYIDSKKTTLYIPAAGDSRAPAVSASVNDTIYAQYNYAPKLKTIDASAYEGKVTLGSANSSIAADLKAGKGGSTLYSGTNNDNLYGSSVAGSSDTFVYTVDSLTGGGKDKIYNFNGITDGDIIKIDGYNEDIHSLALTEKSGKSLSIAINRKDNNKSIGQIDINENPTNKTIVIVDGDNKIIGVNPATTPIGLAYDEKTGIKTDDKYTGAYTVGSYLIGDNLSDGIEAKPHANESATIRASDYSAKLAVINASTVASSVKEMLIEGNDNAKNVLTAPNTGELNVKANFDPLVDDAVLKTTLKGGLTQADVLNGSSLTGSQDFFYVTPNTKSAKKDTIVNYDENDVIVIQATQNIQNLNSFKSAIATNNNIKFDDKSADAVLTLEKSVITIKDGAGKKLNLMLVNDSGASIDTVDIGHILPNGLKYDAKKISIAVKDKATTEAADVGGDNAKLGLDYNGDGSYTGNKGYIALDLNNSNYFNTVKTINLSKINDKIPNDDDKGKLQLENNDVHVTLLGNALSNEFWAGGNQSGTTIFYGGKGDINKPESDKFYGSKGMDVFVYQRGDGKDAISDNKSAVTTKYNPNDWIVLAGGETNAVLSKDDVYITDNKTVVNVQIGTDTKKGTLVINKDDSNTPIKFVLTKDSDAALAVASQITSGEFDADEESSNYTVYDYGLSDATLAMELNDKGLLTVSGTKNVTLDGEFANTTINAKDISSALKSIIVTGADVAPYIVGNNNANTFTLGKAGGTVYGGYSKDAKGKIKATADKYYGGDGADVFVYDNLFDTAQNDLGGKDIIYNYDPGNDAILINSLNDIKGVKYSEKNVVFTFNGAKAASKNNTLTIQGVKGNSSALPSDTQITFLVKNGEDLVPYTYTYFDKKNTAKMSDLTTVLNPWEPYITYNGVGDSDNVAWTAEDDAAELDVWHYTGNAWTNNGLNFTIRYVADHYANTIPSGHIDVNVNAAGIRPVGVSVDEPGGTVITIDQVKEDRGSNAKDIGVLELTDFTFNANTATGANGIHINGIKPVYSSTGLYDASYVAPVGEYGADDARGEYRLADLDGIASNGYELLKYNYNWDLIQGDKQTWMYHNALNFTLTADRILDVFDYNSDTDMKYWNTEYEGSPVEVYVSNYNMTVGSAITSNMIKFADLTATGRDGTHIKGFDTDTTFTIGQEMESVSGKTTTTVTVPTTFVLAELDGDTDNGYELLKKNDRWKLTPTSWDYSSGTTKFSVNIVAPTLAADETEGIETGAPEGIEVRIHPSISSSGIVVDTLNNSKLGTVIDFSDVKLNYGDGEEGPAFNASMVTLDGGIATGKHGVHIILPESESNVSESEDAVETYSTIKVGEEAYWLVNLDNDMADDYRPFSLSANEEYSNGYELAKVNDKWTPVAERNMSSGQSWAYKDDNMGFVITPRALAYTKYNTVDDSSSEVLNDEDEINRKPFEIDSNGAVKYITVSEDGVINVGAELTSPTTGISIGGKAVTLGSVLRFEDIQFDSDTKKGADGIHIKGYNVDETTELYVSENNVQEYQLVDLDGNSSNGLELLKIDDNWTLEKGAWTYTSDDKNLQFTFDSTSGLAATDDGQASGVSVNGSTIIFDLDESARNKALKALRFTKLTEGIQNDDNNTVHIQGLPADQKITLSSDWDTKTSVYRSNVEYQLVDLDGDSSNGYEIMKVDANWKLSNGAWTFMNASTTALSTLEAAISAHASIGANTDGSGVPANITYDSSTKTLDMSQATNFVATDLTLTKIINTGKGTLAGANGLHIKLAASSEDTNIISPDTQYKIGNDTYQLVDLDEDTTNGYELMKVDANWSLKGGTWSYANGAIAFDIDSSARKVENSNVGLRAQDNGLPSEVTLTYANGSATLSLPDRIANLNDITINKSNYGTVSGALHFKGNTALEGSEITIGTATQKYKLIDLDKNANTGYELMKVDDSWTYKVGGGTADADKYSWTYNGKVNDNTVLAFNLSSVVGPGAEGIPTGTSVNLNTFTITLPKGMESRTTDITLTTASTGTGVGAVHLIFDGAAANAAEGKDIKISDKTYKLYNADGSSDGTYELTNDGWTAATVNGFANGRESNREPADAFRYKSSKADYYLSGSAFGTGLTPKYVAVNSSTGVLSITTTSETALADRLSTARDDFHIRIDKSPSTVTTLKVNGVDFTLKNIDNNTGNGSELVRDGWAKYDDQHFFNTDGNFTLESTSDRDTDTNNVPDGITYTHSSKKITFDSSTFTTATEFSGITFTAARGWNPKVEAEGVTDSTVSIESSTAVAGGLVQYQVTVTGNESGQLPADGYSTSGYAVDDLINYESESAATVDELNDIIDVKPLALDDEFNVSTLFDGGDRSALTSLTHSARHRQKK